MKPTLMSEEPPEAPRPSLRTAGSGLLRRHPGVPLHVEFGVFLI
jgi:hypothetical protein